VQGIAITRLTSADVVRHPLVARIVDAYDKHRSPKAGVNAADEDTDDVVDVKARDSVKPARKPRRKV
jgi:phosphate starvation-inducible PhoH-like protein